MGAESTERGLAALPGPLDGGGMTLVAGRVDAAAESLAPVLAWLRGLRVEGEPEARWWRCAEWTDRVRLEEAGPGVPDDLPRLVWARWFGGAGDLELWREGERFGWRFLGDAEVRPPPGVEHEDYFVGAGDDGSPRVLRPGGDRVGLLWDARDARVATADPETLKYLADAPGRQQVRYTPYYDRGVVAAVRYRRIEGLTEGGTRERKEGVHGG